MLFFACERCGNCCKGDLWLKDIIRRDDVEKWQANGREDILKYVCPCCYRLVDPDKNCAPWRKDNCPFLEFNDGKAQCRIYEVRPQTCKEFPIRKCNNPACTEKFHLHSWLWNGNCEAAKSFKIDMVRTIESQIEI